MGQFEFRLAAVLDAKLGLAATTTQLHTSFRTPADPRNGHLRRMMQMLAKKQSGPKFCFGPPIICLNKSARHLAELVHRVVRAAGF